MGRTVTPNRLAVVIAFGLIALSAVGAIYVTYATGGSAAKGGSHVTPETAHASRLSRSAHPDVVRPPRIAARDVKPCKKGSSATRCIRRAAYRRCAKGSFEGKGCASHRALRRQARSLLADCREGYVIWEEADMCGEAKDVVVNRYLDCRFAGAKEPECEASAVYGACTYRGGGSLQCADALGVYARCRALDGVPRYVCVEGDIEYERCRNAWSVTVDGDVCVGATQVYEECRPRFQVRECEGRRDEYAQSYWR